MLEIANSVGQTKRIHPHTHTHEQAQCMIHVEKRNSEQKNGQIVGKHAANISNKSFANM